MVSYNDVIKTGARCASAPNITSSVRAGRVNLSIYRDSTLLLIANNAFRSSHILNHRVLR